MFLSSKILTRQFINILLVFEKEQEKKDNTLLFENYDGFNTSSSIFTILKNKIYLKKDDCKNENNIQVFLPEESEKYSKYFENNSINFDLLIYIPLKIEFFSKIDPLRSDVNEEYNSELIYQLLITELYCEFKNHEEILYKMINWMKTKSLMLLFISFESTLDEKCKNKMLSEYNEWDFWQAYEFYTHDINLPLDPVQIAAIISEKNSNLPDYSNLFSEFYTEKFAKYALFIRKFSEFANKYYSFAIVSYSDELYSINYKYKKIIEIGINNYKLCFLFFELTLHYIFFKLYCVECQLFIRKIPQKIKLTFIFDKIKTRESRRKILDMIHSTDIFNFHNIHSFLFNDPGMCDKYNIWRVNFLKTRFNIKLRWCEVVIFGSFSEYFIDNLKYMRLISNSDVQILLNALECSHFVSIIVKGRIQQALYLSFLPQKLRIESKYRRCAIPNLGSFGKIGKLIYIESQKSLVIIDTDFLESSISCDINVEKVLIKNSFYASDEFYFVFNNCRIWNLAIESCHVSLVISFYYQIYEIFFSKIVKNFAAIPFSMNEYECKNDNLLQNQFYLNFIKYFQTIFIQNSFYSIKLFDNLLITSKNENRENEVFIFKKNKFSYKLFLKGAYVSQMNNKYCLPFPMEFINCEFLFDGLTLYLKNNIFNCKFSNCFGKFQIYNVFCIEFLGETASIQSEQKPKENLRIILRIEGKQDRIFEISKN